MPPRRFEKTTSDKLNYYVYLYVDPTNDEVFYVGKGRGSRCFTHLDDQGESEKVKRITEIRDLRQEPHIELLAFGLSEQTALKVEAAAIDLIGLKNLTNRGLGHGAGRYGRRSVDTVHAELAPQQLDRFDHDCVVIKVTGSIERARERLGHRFDGVSPESALALYDATRGTWPVDRERAGDVKYALAVHHGVVLEVYEIATWVPAGSTMYPYEQIGRDPKKVEFVGRVAEDKVRDRYRLRSVKHFFKPGDRFPVRYFRAGQTALDS